MKKYKIPFHKLAGLAMALATACPMAAFGASDANIAKDFEQAASELDQAAAEFNQAAQQNSKKPYSGVEDSVQTPQPPAARTDPRGQALTGTPETGYAGTWTDPATGDIITSVIPPAPRPDQTQSWPIVIEPQVNPNWGTDSSSWSGNTWNGGNSWPNGQFWPQWPNTPGNPGYDTPLPPPPQQPGFNPAPAYNPGFYPPPPLPGNFQPGYRPLRPPINNGVPATSVPSTPLQPAQPGQIGSTPPPGFVPGISGIRPAQPPQGASNPGGPGFGSHRVPPNWGTGRSGMN